MIPIVEFLSNTNKTGGQRKKFSKYKKKMTIKTTRGSLPNIVIIIIITVIITIGISCCGNIVCC